MEAPENYKEPKADLEEDIEEIEDLDTYEDEVAKKVVESFVNTGEKKQKRLLEEVQNIDGHLKYGMTLILNYWAENGQFNQNLLEDLIPLIAKRSKALKKFR